MEVNKLDKVSEIKDEAAKIKILENIWGRGGSSLFTIESAIRDLIMTTSSKGVTVSLIHEDVWRIADSINRLVGIMSDFVNSAKTVAADQDTQLTEALSPVDTTEAFVGEGGSGVAVATNQDAVLVAIGGINKTLTQGFAENTTAVQQAGENTCQTQMEQTKAIIANDEKRRQAEERNKLLNPEAKKNQINPDKKKMPKLEMPKFPVNGKQFMSGLGKILKGILNPVALIAGVFMHLLPYIILAVSFFKGFWKSLATPLKEKVKEVTQKIIFYAGLAFLLFKGPALLIKTLQLAWYAVKVAFAILKWGLEVAFHALRMIFAGEEHAMKISETMFDRICTTIEHVAEMVLKTFKSALAVLEFLVVAAAVIVIVAAIFLLIGGMILLFVLFGDKIAEAVVKIVEVFAMLGGMIYDAIVGFFKLLADIVVNVIVGLIGGLVEALVKGFKWLFGGDEANEKKESGTSETEIKNGVTKDIFAAALEPITDSLNILTTCVADIAAIEASRILNPIGSLFGAVASSVMNLFNGNSNISNTSNADNTSMSVNTSYVSQQKQTDPNAKLREDVASIAKVLKKWYDDRDNDRNKVPNTTTP